MKILFLLKKTQPYGNNVAVSKSGLLNSATLTANALEATGAFEPKMMVCVDGNSIDREIHLFKPRVCVIEALWVTPEKLQQLVRLHPNVLFIIRIHSELPFLANEGIALEWLTAYDKIENVYITCNSEDTTDDLFLGLGMDAYYLPNIYEQVATTSRVVYKDKEVFDIGCFGAIRPMKNQLIQAVAACRFANMSNRRIRFHMNTARLEQGGVSVIKNIRAVFADSVHEFVEHGWLSRPDFLDVIGSMDVNLQVSFTESFNIVAADSIKMGVPVIGSPAIKWLPKSAQADFGSTRDIALHIREGIKYSNNLLKQTSKNLNLYNKKALKEWLDFFDEDLD